MNIWDLRTTQSFYFEAWKTADWKFPQFPLCFKDQIINKLIKNMSDSLNATGNQQLCKNPPPTYLVEISMYKLCTLSHEVYQMKNEPVWQSLAHMCLLNY